MPLPKRCVEPVHVSRGTVPERLAVPSELEAVTNGTLANTVRQLSSLSKHAEDMFGELTREATNLAERTNILQARIDRLAIKVTQLDSGVEEVSLQDIQMRKAFRSTRTFQQQLFSRGSMPSAMLATYARCDRPPPLERLNEFRDDGRDARKFYTDPDYFFELWRREMLQDTERIQHDRGKKVRQVRSGGADGRSARRVRAPHSTRERHKAEAVTRGEHIMAPSQLRHYNIDAHTRPTTLYHTTNVTDGGYRAPQNRPPTSQPARPNSIEIENQQNRQPRLTGNGHVMGEESPYGTAEPIYGGSMAGTPRRARPSVPPPAPPAPLSPPDEPASLTPTRSALPPPPPPPEAGSPPPMLNGASPPHRTALDAHLDQMHAVIGMMSTEGCAQSPPPPLRPPAPSVALASAPSATPPPAPLSAPGGAVDAGAVGVADVAVGAADAGGATGGKRSRSPSPAAHLPPVAELHHDLRSDLLKIIRQGLSNDEPKNMMEIEAKQSGPKVVKLIVLRKVKTENEDADSTPEKASTLEKKGDDGPDSSGFRSDESQDGRSHATVIRDQKFQRASHLFRRQHTHAEKRPFKCGSCGHDFAHSDDVLKHSGTCKREEQIVDITEESAVIKVESKSDASDVSPRSDARSPRPPAPKRGSGRPLKRVPNFMRKKKLGTSEKASKLEKKDDDGPDSSGSSSDDLQDGRSHATVIRDQKFQRASHLFRRHAGETDTEKQPFKCGSCGRDFARSDDALVHSRICKREEQIVDITEESAVIKVESKSDASDVSPRRDARSPRPPAPKRGRERPLKRVPKFMHKKKLDKKICKPKRVVLKPRLVFKPPLTLAEQQLQLKRTRGRPPKNYYNRKKDIHKKPSLIMQGTTLYNKNSTSQNMQTVDLQNLEDSSSDVITESLSPILRPDGDRNRNVNLSPFYGFANPTKITDVQHTSFDVENSSKEEPEVIVPHVFMQTQIESEENVPSIGMETTIMSEKEIVKPIPNKEEIKDEMDQVQTEANDVSTSTTSSITIIIHNT